MMLVFKASPVVFLWLQLLPLFPAIHLQHSGAQPRFLGKSPTGLRTILPPAISNQSETTLRSHPASNDLLDMHAAPDAKEASTKAEEQPAKPKKWHEDINFLASVMFTMLPCLGLAVLAFEWLHQSWAEVDFNISLPAVDPEQSRTELSRLFGGFGTLTLPYFCSDAGRKGRLYVCVVLLLGISALFLALVHNAWQKEFWDAFEKKNSVQFFHLLKIFSCLVAFFVLNDVYSQYIRQMLYIHWRDFMTRMYVRRWLGASAHYTMQLDQDPRRRVENPDQRIQEDIHLFVDTTIIISYELLNSIGHLIVFLPLLLMLSPTMAFGAFYCPGWLLYLAFTYSLLGTFATHGIGNALIPLGFARQQFEADFRFGLVRVRDHSESIVLYRGERSEQLNLTERFERIKVLWWKQMLYQKRLAYFTRTFSLVQMIIPFFILAPSYFKGDITMGTLFQISSALGTVCNSFDYIVNAYGTLTTWRATADRLLGFEKAMTEARKASENCKAVRSTGPPGTPIDGREPESLGLAVQDLTVRLPDGTLLWKDLSFSIPRGQRVLLTGREGIGKTVLFRALAGAWPYVEDGKLWFVPPEAVGKELCDSRAESDEKPELHTDRKVLFVPQKTYFPAFCTLRGALSYPEDPQFYNDEQLLAALHEVKLETILDKSNLTPPMVESKSNRSLPPVASAKDAKGETAAVVGEGLDMEAKWSLVLSPGQQQRLAFARVLLLQPDLLFLDEATSNLSQESTREFYGLLKTRLDPQTTVVSISHEVDLLAPMHDRLLVLEGDELVDRDPTCYAHSV